MKYLAIAICLILSISLTNAQCVIMTQKSVTDTTATGAKINWATLPNTVIGVRVAYRKVVTGVSQWTYVLVPNVDSSYTITGLTPGTQYGVRVSSKCTPNLYGPLTAEKRFTTLVAASSKGISNSVIVADPQPTNTAWEYIVQNWQLVLVTFLSILGNIVLLTPTAKDNRVYLYLKGIYDKLFPTKV